MKRLFLILAIVIIFLTLNKKEHFASSGAFHAIRLLDTQKNINNHLNESANGRVENFDNVEQKGFNPSNYVIFPYSSWELKGNGQENPQDPNFTNKITKNVREASQGSPLFQKNDAGSGINLDSSKQEQAVNRTSNFNKHKDLILSRGGNKAKEGSI